MNMWRIGKWVAVRGELTNTHVVDWRAVMVFSGSGDQPLFGDLERHSEDPDSVSVYASGHIKWDGCINMNFDEQNSCMLHFCGVDHAQEKLGELFELLHDVATQLCEPYRHEHSRRLTRGIGGEAYSLSLSRSWPR